VAPSEIALVLTGQHTNEEYEALLNTFTQHFKTKNVFHWWPQQAQASEFDGLLIRGDKNPNTAGLQQALKKYGVGSAWSDLENGLTSSTIKHLVVVGPENLPVYDDLSQKIELFSQAEHLYYMTSVQVESLQKSSRLKNAVIVPLKSYIEKDGTFINYNGQMRQFKKATIVVSEALSGVEAAALLAGQALKIQSLGEKALLTAVNNTRADQVTLENRKKNEFIFNRGRL